MLYYGVVEDRNDPELMGRVRVRIAGVHTQNKQEVPTDALPWSVVMTPTTSPSTSGVGATPYLVEGSWVVCMFLDENMQEALVIGTIPGKQERMRSGGTGFSSPTGTFPKYVGKPDIPLAAQPGEYVNHPTMVARDQFNVEEVIHAAPARVSAVAQDQEEEFYERTTWYEPTLEATRKHDMYPLNYVEEYEGGHVVEYGNTPGEERFSYTHPSGSYVEFNGSGEITLKSSSNAREITIKDKNIFVRGDYNLSVYGNMKHYVKGDYVLEVGGNYLQRIHKSRQTKITSNDEIEIGQDLSMAIGKNSKTHIRQNRTTFILAGDDTLTVASGKSTETITGDVTQKVTGNRVEITTGNKQEMTLKNSTYYGKSGFKLETSGNMVAKVKLDFDMDADGNVDIDANEIYLN